MMRSRQEFDEYFSRVFPEVNDHNRGVLGLAYEQGHLDFDFYRDMYGAELTDAEIIEHFLSRSNFDGRSYSAKLDVIGYLLSNPDLAAVDISPVEHFVLYGAKEGRSVSPRFRGFSHAADHDKEFMARRGHDGTVFAGSQRIAFHLHIYYPDYVERFLEILKAFPFTIDVLVSSPISAVEAMLSPIRELPNVNRLEFTLAQNRGRNFGPLLVDYRHKLNNYDLVCHLHSKKSLFTGREQRRWSDYLMHFLVDPDVITRHMSYLETRPEVGLLGLVPFWQAPHWASHWLKNEGAGRELFEKLGVGGGSNGFHTYPVGGMFWLRPRLASRLLDYPWSYEDFSAETGQTDGTLHHAIERAISSLIRAGGSTVGYYEPWTNRYVTNVYDNLGIYRNESRESVIGLSQSKKVISFDFFDTLVYRDSHDVDHAKRKVGALLAADGIVPDPAVFVKLRNAAEAELRRKYSFAGDVGLPEIYGEIGESLDLPRERRGELAEAEYLFDRNDLRPRPVMIDICNLLAERFGKTICIVSDTYYSRAQVHAMVRKAGLRVPFRLYVSSDMHCRKDTGQIWRAVLSDLGIDAQAVLHIGDNMVSDVQIPTELGVPNFYVMHILDKAGVFLGGRDRAESLVRGEVGALWKPVVEALGRDPFFNKTGM